MPTPPPWCRLTQVAPPAVLSSALSSGQSETASLPSRMLSVSRFGDATEPESRWSRPITIGAFSSPRLHHLVEGQTGAMALAEADPADARRQALERDALARHVEPAVQVRVVGEEFLHLRVGLADVLRVARERDPAKRPLAAAEQRPDVGRHEAGEVERVLHALVERDLADVVAVVDGRDAHRLEVEHRPHVHRASLGGGVAQLGVLRRIGRRRLPAVDASSPAAGSR